MKIDATVSESSVREDRLGPMYVGHFKCGTCRYVVQCLGSDTYYLTKQRIPGWKHEPEIVGGHFRAPTRIKAMEKACGYLQRSGIGIHRTIMLENPKTKTGPT